MRLDIIMNNNDDRDEDDSVKRNERVECFGPLINHVHWHSKLILEETSQFKHEVRVTVPSNHLKTSPYLLHSLDGQFWFAFFLLRDCQAILRDSHKASFPFS